MIELPKKENQKVRETVELLNDFAVQMRAQGRFETARIALERAIRLDATVPEVHANYGCVLMNLGEQAMAHAAMRLACNLKPENPDHWGNLAILCGAMQRYGEAEEAFDRVMALVTPWSEKGRGARWDRALQRLEQGDWLAAWPDYETRIARRGAQLYQQYPCPLWQGEGLDGKTLYVQAEQGIGDTLAFSRFLHEVKRRWPSCRLMFGCPDKLIPLLWCYRELAELLPSGALWPEGVDYATYLCSLPGALKITPATLPEDPGLVLKRAQKARFILPTPNLPSLKIGVAWTGNPAQDRNHERQIPLEHFLRLTTNPKLCLYSLQVGPGEEDLDRLGAAELIYPLAPSGPHGAGLKEEGLVAAAAAMLAMDLVVTVCTSTAHLAGVLGVPCLLLLCQDPYWIWNRQGDKSAWYPSITIFRQEKMGDWGPVMDAVEDKLNELTSSIR